MNGHPGRVTTRDTDPTRDPRGSQAVDRPGERPLPRGTEAPSSPIRPLCARKDSVPYRRPNRLGSFPAGRLTAAVTTAPRPTRCPAQPVVSRQPRPLSRTPAARGRPSPFLPRLRLRRLPQEAPARAPGSRWVWPRPLPAPPPACSPLPPAPPPPSPAAAAATAAGSVTSAPAGPSLPHCAAGGGGRSALRGGKGGALGGRPRPLRAAL